jgi:hypothetical protein
MGKLKSGFPSYIAEGKIWLGVKIVFRPKYEWEQLNRK